MSKDVALFLICLGVCLHSWAYLGIYAMSVQTAPAPDEEFALASVSVPYKGNAVKEASAEMTVSDGLATNSPAKSSSAGTADTKNDANGGRKNSSAHIRRANDNGQSGNDSKKQKLRILKRREAHGSNPGNRPFDQNQLNNQPASRNKRSLSVSNALTVLTNAFVEQVQQQLEQDRENLRQRLLKVGKRSETKFSDRIDEQDIVALLKSALST